jgi:hypothetical protein
MYIFHLIFEDFLSERGDTVQRALLLYNILLGPVNSVKKICEKGSTGGGWGVGVGAQHMNILMMTENPPEQLNQKCAKRLKVYTAHVAN